jgi:hypothetical protein
LFALLLLISHITTLFHPTSITTRLTHHINICIKHIFHLLFLYLFIFILFIIDVQILKLGDTTHHNFYVTSHNFLHSIQLIVFIRLVDMVTTTPEPLFRGRDVEYVLQELKQMRRNSFELHSRRNSTDASKRKSKSLRWSKSRETFRFANRSLAFFFFLFRFFKVGIRPALFVSSFSPSLFLFLISYFFISYYFLFLISCLVLVLNSYFFYFYFFYIYFDVPFAILSSNFPFPFISLYCRGCG